MVRRSPAATCPVDTSIGRPVATLVELMASPVQDGSCAGIHRATANVRVEWLTAKISVLKTRRAGALARGPDEIPVLC